MTMLHEAAASYTLPSGSLDDVVSELFRSRILEVLVMTNHDLEAAYSEVVETVTATHEFLVSLRDAGVLETFYRLQRAHQAYFLRVIGLTAEGQLRTKRIGTFVSAMKMSPLSGQRDQELVGAPRTPSAV